MIISDSKLFTFCVKSPYRKLIFLISIVLIMLPGLLILQDQRASCGFILLLMGTLWVSEIVPLPVTALLPILLLPMFGILPIKEVTPKYFKDVLALLIGGLMMAIAVERANLHSRIALRVLLHVGNNPRWLLLGFMLTTWFLSMWISNTASTAMMLPIAEAVLKQLEIEQLQDNRRQSTNVVELRGFSRDETLEELEGEEGDCGGSRSGEAGGALKVIAGTSETEEHDDDRESCEEISTPAVAGEDSQHRRLGVCLVLSIAYSATIGGTVTLTGTATNLIAKDFADSLWQRRLNSQSPITFTSFLAFSLPNSLLILLVAWLWLQVFHLRNIQPLRSKEIIKEAYDKLGLIRYDEIMILILFTCLVLLWFFREPDFIAGWGEVFKEGFTSDATPAIFMAISLFFIPAASPLQLVRRGLAASPSEMLLDWKTFSQKMPWGVVFLLGGGLALADATVDSCLSDWIGKQLQFLESLPKVTMMIILCLGIAFFTEITSNVAATSLLLPIVEQMAENMNVHPLYLILPATISVSFAFMLPVATPPNAIIFASGRVTIMDMVKSGFLLNFIGILTATLSIHTWGVPIFNLNELPWEKNNTLNNTDLCVPKYY